MWLWLSYKLNIKAKPAHCLAWALMHVVVLCFTPYIVFVLGAALVSEWGVLVRKEISSGVRKGLCE